MWYTMFPVFSLVLDEDVTEEIAFQFPELYRDLQKVSTSSVDPHQLNVLVSCFILLQLYSDTHINGGFVYYKRVGACSFIARIFHLGASKYLASRSDYVGCHLSL